VTADLRAAHDRLVGTLRQQRNSDGGWPYYSGRRSRLESTCWAVLGTGAALDSTPLPGWAGHDGLLVEPATGKVNYAFNGLAALTTGADRGAQDGLTRGIVTGLIGVKGMAADASPVIQQDTRLQGWSWTPGTFTWVEPTAWCMLALKRWPQQPAAARQRVDEAERVLRDRACAEGGWNFGNGVVYGHALPAHVPPTAVGVLAMQDHASDPVVAAAVRHLDGHALLEGSTTALALSALALMAVGHPAEAIVKALVAQCANADTSTNSATLGMAACALAAAATGAPPRALTLAAGSLP
jgi:hypothetical protein